MTRTTKEPIVALVGNPNSGKTTIFNQLTGSNQRVGNWSGVTVERRDGWLTKHTPYIRITDLPGMYSLSVVTPDERIARDFITRGVAPDGRPDLIVQVIDSNQLERSLLLTLQLLEQEIPVIVALNMMDEVRRRGIKIDAKALSKRLGVTVVPTVGKRGEGILRLADTIVTTLAEINSHRHNNVKYDSSVERIVTGLRENLSESDTPLTRGEALEWLAGHPATNGKSGEMIAEAVATVTSTVSPPMGNDWEDSITHSRYAFISRLLADIVTPGQARGSDTLTAKIDSVLVDKVWGLPLFLLFMLLLFELTFKVGAYPMDWIDSGVTALANLVQRYGPEGFITDLLANGVISGAGMVLVFLPNIIILMMGIYLLEDSGYMARAAFLMDRVMRLMGLHGRAFIPLLMSFGCNVPGLLGVRTLETRRERLITMLLIPLMSCSARLPVYVMVTTAFFSKYGGIIIFGLYLLGSLLAVGFGRLFGKVLLKGQTAPFVMELPPYRFPTARTTWALLRMTVKIYLKKIGGVVLAFAIGIWFLANYPKPEQVPAAPVDSVDVIQATPATGYHQGSYIYKMGRFIEPFFAPLKFNLPMDIALVSGFVAKEVVVATMGVLLTGSSTAEAGTLVKQLRDHVPSPASALAFLVFVLLYTPCLTTIVTLHREARKWRWTLFSIAYQTATAYAFAFLTLKVAELIL